MRCSVEKTAKLAWFSRILVAPEVTPFAHGSFWDAMWSLGDFSHRHSWLGGLQPKQTKADRRQAIRPRSLQSSRGKRTSCTPLAPRVASPNLQSCWNAAEALLSGRTLHPDLRHFWGLMAVLMGPGLLGLPLIGYIICAFRH